MEFQAWPKTYRLYRDIVVTEKLDGTNAAIHIEPYQGEDPDASAYVGMELEEPDFTLGAQSRNRLITPESDNYTFARWVWANAETLVDDLGPGTHFGEWWGQGIQRRYDLDHKRFSLFNTAKWSEAEFQTPGLHVVPVLYSGVFDEAELISAVDRLVWDGSVAAPGFMNPEGVCIFHTQTRQVLQYTLAGDGHKG